MEKKVKELKGTGIKNITYSNGRCRMTATSIDDVPWTAAQIEHLSFPVGPTALVNIEGNEKILILNFSHMLIPVEKWPELRSAVEDIADFWQEFLSSGLSNSTDPE